MRRLTVFVLSALVSSCWGYNLVPAGNFNAADDGLGYNIKYPEIARVWVRTSTSINYGEASATPKVYVAKSTSGPDAALACGGLVIDGMTSTSGAGVKNGYFDIGNAPKYTLSFKYGYKNITGDGIIKLTFTDGSTQLGTYTCNFNWTTSPDPNPADVFGSNTSLHSLPGGGTTIWIEKSIKLTRGIEIPQTTTKVQVQCLSVNGTSATYQIYFDDVWLQADIQSCDDVRVQHFKQDLNKDCVVNMSDAALFIENWIKCTDLSSSAMDCSQFMY